MIRRIPAQHPNPKKAGITCRQVTDLILEYVSGQLDPLATAEFKSHLRECPDCIAFLSTYQNTVQAAQSLRYESIPLQMRRRVRQFLKEKIKGTPPRR